MNTAITPEMLEVLEAIHYRPSVSIFLPFEPKMGLKKEITTSLKNAAEHLEKELQRNYPNAMGKLVMQKLKATFRNLNYNTHKKSIAIFLSPVFEKIIYLDIPVEEKVIIDGSFEIRDLVFCKKQLHKYLVLVLNHNESRIFLSDSSHFVRLVFNNANTVNAPAKNGAKKGIVPAEITGETMLNKFLHHVDNGLNHILTAYHYPLFVIGPEKVVAKFKKISHHTAAVIEFINGNMDNATIPHLKDVLEPHINDWKKVKEKELMQQLNDAAGKKKLAIGMREVWRQATNKNGKLLVVEKNFMYAAEQGSKEEIIYKAIEPYNKFSYIKDAVDDVIEKVLENGGDVEFVDDMILKDHHHIALVKYY
jgi:Bacterial archaeo-eukaryotic release factor family 3